MQILFACTFENSDSRVEFCHEILEEARSEGRNSFSSVPGDLKSYSFARGTSPTELYFTPTTHFFKFIDAEAIDQKIYGRGVTEFIITGYQNVDFIYAALLAVDDSLDGFYGAEVRVFENSDDFQAMETGSEVGRYFCESGSVTVNQQEFRP